MNIREFFNVDNGAHNSSMQISKAALQAGQSCALSGITIYRRERSAVWQCRFKLAGGTWHRLSTGCTDYDQAREEAIKLAEQWTIRETLGLPVKQPSFTVVANMAIQELRTALAAGNGKVVYRDYIAVIERYLIPFFGRMTLEKITPEVDYPRYSDTSKPQAEARSNASELTSPKWL